MRLEGNLALKLRHLCHLCHEMGLICRQGISDWPGQISGCFDILKSFVAKAPGIYHISMVRVDRRPILGNGVVGCFRCGIDYGMHVLKDELGVARSTAMDSAVDVEGSAQTCAEP